MNKLVTTPWKVTGKEADAFREAGFSDRTYVDVLDTTAIQNALDRLSSWALGIPCRRCRIARAMTNTSELRHTDGPEAVGKLGSRTRAADRGRQQGMRVSRRNGRIWSCSENWHRRGPRKVLASSNASSARWRAALFKLWLRLLGSNWQPRCSDPLINSRVDG